MSPSQPEIDLTRCDTCGGASRAGVCPRCLLRVAIEPEDDPIPADAPTTIGGYELLEVIAYGGMGVVWRARQIRLRRIVALKLLREQTLPGEEPARRFRIEAEAVAMLRHPHIVMVHEVGEIAGRYYFSMELLAGSLATRLRAGPFAPAEAAALMMKVAHALQHAHDHGVLHRDLKPSNILLDEAGEPRVSDFGLARLAGEQDHPTLSGALLGTPAYLAPEQTTGRPSEFTTRSDVYGLGAVFYELLTGRVPFEAQSHLDLLRQIVEEHPPRPSILIPHLDHDLETICLKCLEKEPAARYRSARALAEDLERWIRGEPIQARPVPALERLWKWSIRHKARAALAVTAVLALGTITTLSLLFTTRLRQEITRSSQAEQTAVHRLATQYGEAAAQLVRRGDWLRALPYLAENCALLSDDPAATHIARLRFETIIRMAPRLAQLWLPEGRPHGFDFDDRYQRVVIFADSTALIFDSQSGRLVTSPLVHGDEIQHGHLVADSNRLLCQTQNAQWVLWNTRKGRQLATGTGSIFPVRTAPSVLDRWVAERFLVSHETRVQAFCLATGEAEGEPVDFGVPVKWAIVRRIRDWSVKPTDQSHYLIATADGYLHQRDHETWKEVAPPIYLGKNILLRGYDWNTDTYAFEANGESKLRRGLLDMASWRVSGEVWGKPDNHRVHGWFGSPSRWSVFVREDSGFSLRDARTGSRLMHAQHDAQGFNAAVATRRNLLATASRDGALRIWNDSGQPVTPFLWAGDRPEHLMLDSDGQRLLCESMEPAVRLWERRAGDGAWLTGVQGTPVVGAFFAGGALLLCRSEGLIERWDLARCTPAAPSVDCGQPIHSAVAATPGHRALLIGADSAVLWDVKNARSIGAPLACPEGLRSAALSGDGRRVVLLSEPGKCRVDSPTGLIDLAVVPDARSVVLSPDGSRLLIIGTEQTQLWALSPVDHAPVTGMLTASLSGASGGSFSADGRRLALWGGLPGAGATDARVFECASGLAAFAPFAHSGDVTSGTFSPDGRLLLTTGRDDARLWDLATGQLRRALRDHPLPPHAGGFSPDGTLLWTRTSKELCLWEAATGDLLAPPMSVQGRGAALFSPDGRWLAGFDDKAGIRAWDASPGVRPLVEMRALARLLSGHRLTPEGALHPLTLPELREAQAATHAR